MSLRTSGSWLGFRKVVSYLVFHTDINNHTCIEINVFHLTVGLGLVMGYPVVFMVALIGYEPLYFNPGTLRVQRD